MRLLRFFIQKQQDNSFAIVARIELCDGTRKEVVLRRGQTPKDLQPAFITYVKDQESLQADILHLQRMECAV